MSKFVLTAQLKLQAPTNASKVLNDVRKQLKGVQVPVEVKGAREATKQIDSLTNSTKKAESAATAMGRSFGLAIKRFAAFTVASRAVSLFTNSLANAVDEAIDFQREVVKIAQVTGKTVKELRGLQNTITQLSVGLGTSSKDLLQVTRILSQAGIKANDLEVALSSLAKTTLAPTFEDIEETAEGAVAIISQFGQGVGALEKQLGAINAVAGQFAVESGDLIGAVRRFGGVFKAAGGELEELLGVFTAVRATTRESAESIATGLRTIFTRIQRPKTIEFLREFGVELQNLDGTFVGPFEAAKRLSRALKGLGEGDLGFIRIAEELGGFRQIGKVIPLLQQFEVAERARQAAVDGGNSLTKDAATAQQALAVQITKVKEEFLSLVRGIADSSSFQLFARVALEIASNLIKVADAIKPLIPLIATLAAIKFSQGLGSFFGGAGSAIRGIQSFDPQKRNRGGKIMQFASGGYVPGTGNRDTVPAMLTPGEFVIKKSSVAKLGAGTLEAMNNNKYNKGGKTRGRRGKNQQFLLDGDFGLIAPNVRPAKDIAISKKYSGSDFLSKIDKATATRFDIRENDNVTLKSKYDKVTVGDEGATKTDFGEDGGIINSIASSIDNIVDAQLKARFNLKSIKKSSIQKDAAAKRTISGYAFEQFVAGITRKSAEGGDSAFDFIGAQGNKSVSDVLKDEKLPRYLDAKPKALVNSASKSANEIFKKGLNQRLGNSGSGISIRKFAKGGKVPIALYADAGRVTGNTTKTRDYTLEEAIGLGFKRSILTSGFGKEAVDARLGTSQQAQKSARKQKSDASKIQTGATFGAAFLEKSNPASSGSKSFTVGGKKYAYDLKTAFLDPADATKIKNDIVKSEVQSAVDQTASYLGGLAGEKSVPNKKIPNFQAIVGSIYEAGLAKVSGSANALDADDGRTFDFPGGLGKVAGAFGPDGAALKSIKTDAKVASSSSALKSITDKVKSDLNIKEFANGGNVGTDTVPALLTPGEFVVNRNAAQRIGYGNLNMMNKKGVAKFANGGTVGVQNFADGGVVENINRFLIEPLKKVSKKIVELNAPTLRGEKGKARQAGLTAITTGGAGFAAKGAGKFLGRVTRKSQESLDARTPLTEAQKPKALKQAEKAQRDEIKNRLKVGFEIRKTLKAELEVLNKSVSDQEARVAQGQKLFDQAKGAEKKVIAARLKEEKAILEQAKGDRNLKANTLEDTERGLKQQAFGKIDREEFKKSGKIVRKGTEQSLFGTVGNAEVQRRTKSRQDAIRKREDAAAVSGKGIPFEKLAIGVGAVVGSLGALKPQIDENSSAFARVSASIIGSVQGVLTAFLTLAGAAQALGIKLNAQGLLSFFSGGKLGGIGKGGGRTVSKLVSGKVDKVGQAVGKLGPRFAKFGGLISKAGPALGSFAAALGPLAATVLAGVGVVSLANKAIDAYTKVHEKAKKAIEDGDVAKAEETAAASANAKAANKLAIGAAVAGATIGTAFGPVGTLVGGAIGALVGVVIKIADAFGLLGPAIEFFRDTIGVAFGGASTNTIKAEARLAAQNNKTQQELARNSQKSAEALQRVAAGASTLAQEFEKGNLTGNLENQFAGLEEQRALQASQDADVDGQLGAGARAAIGFAVAGPIGAAVGALTAPDTEAQKAENLRGTLEAERKFSQDFNSQLDTFGKVAKEAALQGQDPAEILKSNPALAAATQFDAQKIARLEAKGSGATANEKLELKIEKERQARAESLNQTIELNVKAANQQLATIKALNFGLGGLADQLSATSKRIESLLTIDQVTNRFTSSVNNLEISLTKAANSLSDAEFESSIDDLKSSLADAGASEAQIANVEANTRGFKTANEKLNRGSPAFARIQEQLSKGDLTPDNIRGVLQKELTKGVPKEVADKINKAIEGAKIGPEELAKIAAGDFSGFTDALNDISGKFNKDVLGILREREKIEGLIIKATQQRLQSEKEFVDAQRKAIDIQLEAGKLFESFGGDKLTSDQKAGARLARFNVGTRGTGVRGLQSGDASEIQRVAGDIAARFNSQENRARAGAVGGVAAFTDADADQRGRLKTLQQDLIATTKSEIQARKEEIDLIKKKNAAEKSSLEKLLQGDVAGFLEGQNTAGAAAALRTGDASLTSLFSSSALGSGLKSLESTGEATTERASLALSSVGITDPSSAGILGAGGAEVERLNAEGRELAATLGQLGQQAAEFERTEINTKQAIINAANVELSQTGFDRQKNLNPRGLAKGGTVYASTGMFVPRGTDTVPAMLTPGEFVVNRSAVQRGNNLQILRAMNTTGSAASGPGRMSGGGQVQYYNLGGIVEGIGNAISGGAAGLQGVFDGFTNAVNNLINSEFSVKLDTTNVNVNFNGGSFLSSLREDIKNELLAEVGNEIQKYRANSAGDLQKSESITG